jgi:hypothetical protein
VVWQEEAEKEATDNLQKVEQLATSITTEAAQVEQDAAVVTEEAQKEAMEAAQKGDEGMLEKVGGACLLPHPARARLVRRVKQAVVCLSTAETKARACWHDVLIV